MLAKKRHQNNFQRILAKGFEEGDLHLLGLCDVGEHRQGLKTVRIHPQDLMDDVLAPNEYSADAQGAYMSVWHEAGAAQPGTVLLRLLEEPTCVTLSSRALESQLVIWDFRVRAHGHGGKVGRLLQGLLHIRTPSDQRRLSETTKKRQTKEALRELERMANRCVVQPAVCILTGDVNLEKDSANALVQPEFGEPNLQEHWHTETSNVALSGDVAFVKGAASKAWDVTIGASYLDRGMGKDQHDFFGMTLKVPLVQVPTTHISEEGPVCM